jgi:hypothetical protein
MRPFITYKRWALRDGFGEDKLIELVRTQIVPAYKKLPGCLKLGLQHITGTRSYLATQYWRSHEMQQTALAADSYPAWYAVYGPALERWDRLMVFEAEWECDEILDENTK